MFDIVNFVDSENEFDAVNFVDSEKIHDVEKFEVSENSFYVMNLKKYLTLI